MADTDRDPIQLDTPEDMVTLIRAMGAAGYAYDTLESTDSYIRFFCEGGSMMTMSSWNEVDEWLNGVVFDDPIMASHVETILHPDRYGKANPLRALEDAIEQNDNSFDGIINNLPTEPESRNSILVQLKEAQDESKRLAVTHCPKCAEERSR